MGRPNRGMGSTGVKKPGNADNGGGRDQYSLGGDKSSKGTKTKDTSTSRTKK